MTTNMGRVDRAIRIVAAIAVAVLYFGGWISGVWAIVLGVIAAIFVLTSLVGTCPLYSLLGLSTRGRKDTGQGTPQTSIR